MSFKRNLSIVLLCLGLAGSIGFLNKKRTERLEDKIYKEQKRLELVLEERREKKVKEVYDSLDEKTKELVDLSVEFIKEDNKRQVCEKVKGEDPRDLFYPFNEACDNKFEDTKKRLDNFINEDNSKAFKEFFEKYIFFNFPSDKNGGYLHRYFGPKAGNKHISVTIFGKEIDMDFIKFIQVVDTAEEYSQSWKKNWIAQQMLYRPEPKDIEKEGTKKVYVALNNIEQEGIYFWRDCEIRKIRRLSEREIDKAYLEICDEIWEEAKQNSMFNQDKNLAFIYTFVEKDMREKGAYHEGDHFCSVNDENRVDRIDNETYAELSSVANNPSKYMVLEVIGNNKNIRELFINNGWDLKELFKTSKENPLLIRYLIKSLIKKI